MLWVSIIANLCHAFNVLQAAESITKIAAVLTPQQIEQHYIPLLNRLSHGEWFTSRTSSAALYAPVYPKVSSAIQEDLRKGFAALGSDDTPMVRRAAAKWLGVSAILCFLSVTY
jgi:serine/threonine-protein phosphatase 2A regulatory subunit A